MTIIIAMLLSQLGADNFTTREKAHAALVKLGPIAHSHLALAENSPDQEVRARARRILEHWYAENAERLAGEHGKMPWPAGHENYQLIEAARIKVGFGGPPDWLDYREATRALVVDMYRNRNSRAEVLRVLTELQADEDRWKAQFAPPPINLPR